jgi:amidase
MEHVPTTLVGATAKQIARAVRRGDTSATQVVADHLEQIAISDPELHAFRVVRGGEAMTEAEKVDDQDDLSNLPLAGVPVAVKENTAVAGLPTWNGSAAVRTEVAEEDHEVVRRLRGAGAVVVGVSRAPELSQWPFTDDDEVATRNPWSLDRTPGGSSGGSAAAVASGLVPMATANDGLGSIRIPAACCGLFGLQPHRGRIPTTPFDEVWNGLTVYGFLARTVRDTALLYEAVTGNPSVAAAASEPGRLRIALSLKIPPGSSARLHGDWRRAAEQTAELLRSLGHEVVERDPAIGVAGINTLTRYLSGVYEESVAADERGRLERRTRRLARAGALAHRRLPAVRAAEARDAARINAIFDDVDVVLGPTLARSAIAVGRYEGRGAAATLNGVLRWVPFNGIWNHLGNPAAAVPAGFDADGMPLSVQLVGPPDSEAALLSLSAQLEAARPWADQRPPVS